MSVIIQALHSYLKKYPIQAGACVGIAVSGGADSLCLAIGLTEISQKYGLKVKAVTVNHGLRSEAVQEAENVRREMEKIGVPHDVLLWKGKKPTTRIEEKAREKRYELLENWCREKGIVHLFLGHHAGDQAETFWARLARGSGVDGLSAMGACVKRNDIWLCRPLLNVCKKDCEADLRSRQIPWAEDSMNVDESYERVRWRNRQEQMDAYGLTSTVLGRSIKRLQRVREAIDFYTARFFDTLVDVMPEGYALIQLQAFQMVPVEVRLRVIEKTLKEINPSVSVISLDAMEKWLDKMPKKATLAGCVLTLQKGALFVSREVSRLEQNASVPANTLTHWDRFLVLASCPVQIVWGNKDKSLPVDVRNSIPYVSDNIPVKFIEGTQKGLEKQFALDYKKRKQKMVIFMRLK